MKKRKNLEKKRYTEKYGVDYFNLENYDVIIDTTSLKPQEIADKIIQFMENQKNR